MTVNGNMASTKIKIGEQQKYKERGTKYDCKQK
jgi:hypothetical protein